MVHGFAESDTTEQLHCNGTEVGDFGRSEPSLVAQMVKNLSAMEETKVRSLGRKDPLEKGTATYSSILSWRIPWTEKPGGLQSMGLQRVIYD